MNIDYKSIVHRRIAAELRQYLQDIGPAELASIVNDVMGGTCKVPALKNENLEVLQKTEALQMALLGLEKCNDLMRRHGIAMTPIGTVLYDDTVSIQHHVKTVLDVWKNP